MDVAGIGDVELEAAINGKLQPVTLTDVWHVPAMTYNLISFGTLNELGCDIQTEYGRWQIVDDDRDIVFQGPMHDKMMLIDVKGVNVANVMKTHSFPVKSKDRFRGTNGIDALDMLA